MNREEKTVEEWFNEVADKELRRALLSNTRNGSWDSLQKTRKTLADALECAFPWNDFNSPPGYMGWMKMHGDMQKNPESYMSKLCSHKEKLNI